MTGRDDMVFRIDPEDDDQWRYLFNRTRNEHGTNHAVRRAKGRKGLIRKLIRARRKKARAQFQARRRVMRTGLGKKPPGIPRAAMGRSAARGARMFANPVGLAVAGVILAIAVAGRLASGRSFEGMGRELEGAILGEDANAALAKIMGRSRFTNDPRLMQFLGEDKTRIEQFRRIFRLNKAIDETEIKGRREILKKFDVNSKFDILILRVRDVVVNAWNASGGKEMMDKLIVWFRGFKQYKRLMFGFVPEAMRATSSAVRWFVGR